MNKTCATIGIIMMVFGAISGLAAIWWWALHGMSSEVGVAWTATSVGLVFVGVFTAIAPVD